MVLAPEVTVDVDEGSAEGGMTPIEPSPESALPDDREVRPGSAADDLTMVEEADDARESVGVDTVSVDGAPGDGSRTEPGRSQAEQPSRPDIVTTPSLARSALDDQLTPDPLVARLDRGPDAKTADERDSASLVAPVRRSVPEPRRSGPDATPDDLPPSFGRSTAVPSEPESTGETPQRPGPETMPDTMPDSMHVDRSIERSHSADPRTTPYHPTPPATTSTDHVAATGPPPADRSVGETAEGMPRAGTRQSQVRVPSDLMGALSAGGVPPIAVARDAVGRAGRQRTPEDRAPAAALPALAPRVLRQASAPQHREPVQSRAALVTGDLAVGAPAPDHGCDS